MVGLGFIDKPAGFVMRFAGRLVRANGYVWGRKNRGAWAIWRGPTAMYPPPGIPRMAHRENPNPDEE